MDPTSFTWGYKGHTLPREASHHTTMLKNKRLRLWTVASLYSSKQIIRTSLLRNAKHSAPWRPDLARMSPLEASTVIGLEVQSSDELGSKATQFLRKQMQICIMGGSAEPKRKSIDDKPIHSPSSAHMVWSRICQTINNDLSKTDGKTKSLCYEVLGRMSWYC